MGNCDVHLEVDDDSLSYQTGDRISGRAGVATDSEIGDAKLKVFLEWYTHGRGNRAQKALGSQTVYSGDWPAGAEEWYDFGFEAPSGPYTYRGHYVNVDWRIRATADIPWALDPEAELDLALEPAPDDEYAEKTTRIHETRVADAQNVATIEWGRLVFGLIFATVPCAMMGGGLMGATGGGQIVVGLFLAAFTGVGLWMIYSAVRNRLAATQLESCDVALEPGEVAPGESVTARLRLTPSSEITLNGLSMALKGRERAVSGSGTDRTTHTHLFHESEETIPESTDTTIPAGNEREYETTFELPDDAPFTFHADDNDVQWQVEFHLDIDNWPDVVHSDPLFVRPSRDDTTEAKSPETATPSDEGEETYEVVW